jgi:hypothetical protein
MMRPPKEQEMNKAAFDTIARGVSRRASLAALSAAGLVALAKPSAIGAKKKKKSKNKCAAQEQQCLAVAKPLCSGDPDCEHLVEEGCQFAGFCEPVLAVSIIQSATL